MNRTPEREKSLRNVSVIIVNWNTKDLLLSCIRSLKKEIHKATLEIIVVDNASTDDSQGAVKQHFPDVKLIQNDENLGFAKANNIGIRASSGKYVCLVNSDVIVKTGCLDRMCDYMEKDPKIGMLGPKIFYPDGTVQLSCRRFPSVWKQFCRTACLHRVLPRSRIFASTETTFFSYDKVAKVDVLIGAFWLLRREAIAQVGLLDERFFFYAEDTDWCKRFWEKGWEVVFFPGAEIIHYTAGSSGDAPTEYYIQLHRAGLQYWKKHHCGLLVICAKALMMIHQVVRLVVRLTLLPFRASDRKSNKHKIKRSLACFRWLLTN